MTSTKREKLRFLLRAMDSEEISKILAYAENIRASKENYECRSDPDCDGEKWIRTQIVGEVATIKISDEILDESENKVGMNDI